MMHKQVFITKLLRLLEGERIPSGNLKGSEWEQMKEEGLLIPIRHGSRCSFRIADAEFFMNYLKSKYGFRDIEALRELAAKQDVSRSELVNASGDSKLLSQRTFKGFLVNCYTTIQATLHNKALPLQPMEGSFTFIYDYTDFLIPEEVVIVGIENAENFRQIQRQRQLFEYYFAANTPLLFVSRYPQNGDLVRWLQGIPNTYVHFGDLDLAGIRIFLTEFQSALKERSSFLIPHDYVNRIRLGSFKRYNDQLPYCRNLQTEDAKLQELINCIHHYHRGYDQEGYIDHPEEIKNDELGNDAKR